MPALQLSPFARGAQLKRSSGTTRRHTWAVFAISTRPSSIRTCPVATAGQQQQQHQYPLTEPAPWPLIRPGLVMAATAAVMMASAPPSLARLELPNKEVDDATSPLVQKLLKRTEENRERYKRERLQDYYRRNFKEYFEFEASSAKVARARGLSTESQEAIARWLEENK